MATYLHLSSRACLCHLPTCVQPQSVRATTGLLAGLSGQVPRPTIPGVTTSQNPSTRANSSPASTDFGTHFPKASDRDHAAVNPRPNSQIARIDPAGPQQQCTLRRTCARVHTRKKAPAFPRAFYQTLPLARTQSRNCALANLSIWTYIIFWARFFSKKKF